MNEHNPRRTTPNAPEAWMFASAMHELSIAQNLIDLVTEALDREQTGPLLRVHLQIGAFSGVVPEALLFCYEVASRGTLLEGSNLVIESIPLRLLCPLCDRVVEPTAWHDWRCPDCGSYLSHIVQGKELQLISIEVQHSPHAHKSSAQTDSPNTNSSTSLGNSLA